MTVLCKRKTIVILSLLLTLLVSVYDPDSVLSVLFEMLVGVCF